MGLLLFIQLLSFVLLVPDTVTSCGDDVCYPDLGCFPNDAPWCTDDRPVPLAQSPEEIKTTFNLYTRSRPTRFVVPTWPTISLNGSGYDSSKRSVFFVIGYSTTVNDTTIINVKNAILSAIDVNMFLVGWTSQLNYVQDVSNTRVIGREMARFGLFLFENNATTPSNFHLIGHSLGAQICSYMGKNISGINRLTALDPASPLYEGYTNEIHITSSDAANVDVLHTDARVGGAGTINPVGDVDFYVSGGSNQPGCPDPVTEGKISFADCSHNRAIHLFTDAVQYTNCTFWGHKTTFNVRYAFRTVDAPPCILNTCTPMGLRTFDYTERGIFYVGTTGISPYCDPADKTARKKRRSFIEKCIAFVLYFVKML